MRLHIYIYIKIHIEQGPVIICCIFLDALKVILIFVPWEIIIQPPFGRRLFTSPSTLSKSKYRGWKTTQVLQGLLNKPWIRIPSCTYQISRKMPWKTVLLPFSFITKQLLKDTRWWQLKYFFNFHPYMGKWSNLTCAYFSIGLVQPPTREMHVTSPRCPVHYHIYYIYQHDNNHHRDINNYNHSSDLTKGLGLDTPEN